MVIEHNENRIHARYRCSFLSLTFSYSPYEYFVVLYVESVNVIMIHFDKKKCVF